MSSLSDRIAELSPQKRERLLRKLQGAGKEKPDATTIRRRIEQDKYPLSYAQRRLWFLDQLEPGKASYNIPAALRFTGALDTAALERSLNEIVRRHEVLRSTFVTVKDDPQQIILPALTLSLSVTDLQFLPEEEREQEAQRLAQAEAQVAFDLAHGPLLRASLLRLAETEYLLILVMHHIVADGWSAGIFLRELAVIYPAFASGRPLPLAELPIQYADFAHWQQEEQIKGDLLASQIGYWTKQLSSAPLVLDLPADRPRPPIQTYNGAHLTVTLPKQLAADVAALSQREGVTPFVTLLAAFQSLLSRYTGQEDLCVGTPVANRRYRELDGLIGFFVNTLVMRADVSGDPSFRDLLHQVRETHLSADAHQDLPFEMLVEAMQPERDLSRSPLFQVMFAYQQPVAAPDLPSLAIRALEIETSTAKFDLLLTVELGPTGLRTIWEYSTDLFDKATIARMAGHYQRLLAAAVADPDLQISRLPLLTSAERRQILDQWNDTAITYHPRGACLHQLFEAQVARTPTAIAISFQYQQLSYDALNKRANQLARRLQRLGVGPDSLVGVSMERSLEMVVALYAILKAGGAYLPIDPTNPPERLAFMLDDARLPVLLTQSHLVSRFPPIKAEMICLDAEHGGAAWDRLAEENAENFDSGVTEENLAYAIYTSGSTGQPKCVLIPHKGICNRLLWMQDEYQLASEDCVLQKTPFSFDVSVWEFFWPLLVGARLVVARPEGHKDSDYLIELIKQERVTTIHFVPSMLQAFLENERARECHSLRRVICSGEALPFELQQRFFARMENAELHNLYGPTEASVDVSYWACERNGTRKTVPIGRPIANTQLYILDRHLQPVPIGVPGELHIGGVNVGRGYLNRPELTAEKFIELRIADCGLRIDAHSTSKGSQNGQSAIRNPQSAIRVYKTGDLTRFLPDGAIEYLGRLDHQVKIRGFRIELGEIEAVLEQHPAIRKAAVIAREERGDKQLVAYCVPEEMPGPAARELRAYLKEKLPDYMTPAAMVMLEMLPLSPNGKLDRRALPAPGKADTASESPYVGPRTPVEEMLAGMWAEVLGIERAGIHDNFFELGGHSLLATRLVSRMRDAFGVNLPLRTLFEKPTVAELATRLEAMRAGDTSAPLAPPITSAPREGGLPLSYAQQRLWFLHQLEPESSFYNIPAFVRMRGQLDIAALERSLGEVVRRHEAMRTIFPDLDGKPVQVIQPPQPVKLRVAKLDLLEQSAEAIQTRAANELQEPFDLAAGPLWRAHLLRLAEDEYLLFLVLHHIIADGWAMNLLVEEIGQLYTAFSAGQPSPLAELPIQYADYARWQRDWLQGETLERQLAYWRGQLGGAPMQLDLPADRPRPPMQTYNGAAQTFTLPAQLANRLRALSRQEGATLFMTLLAAFQALLYRYSGQESINVGTPIANRTRSEIERLLGCFINTLVIRGDFSGDPSFREMIHQVREAALGAYTHQDIPFEMVVDALEPERDLSRSPLFQVMFSLEERPVMAQSLPGLQLEALPAAKTTAKFDLSLEMWEEGEGLHGELEYNTDLFDAATIERMRSHFTMLIESLAADPDQRVSRAPLLTEAERRQMLVEWNATAAVFPADRCVHQLIEAQAARTPDAPAVSFNGRTLSYHDLNQQANRIAHSLRELGVGPETVVGVYLDRSLELVAALLGVLKAGGAYLPLDPLQPEERLSAILSDAQPRAVLTEAALQSKFEARKVVTLTLGPMGLLGPMGPMGLQEDDNPSILVNPDNLAYVIYTSGSTGKPKGVMVEHRSLANAFFAWDQAYGLDAVKNHLQLANVAFDVFTGDFVRALCSGGRLALCPRDLLLSPPELYELMKKERIEIAEFVPAVLRQLAAYLEETGQRLDFLRLLVCGSDAWTAGEYRRFRSLCGPGTRVINSYGITEATIDSTWCETLDEMIAADSGVPIGRPFANVQAYVLDRNLQSLPVGLPGELYLAGAGLARGYLNDAELTAERFIGGTGSQPVPASKAGPVENLSHLRLYKTGDLARWRADGTLQFLGRADYQVKIRGYRIETGEIEAALCKHAGAKQAIVTAHEDDGGRKRLVAYCVPGADGTDEIHKSYRSRLRDLLPEYMIPSAFVMLDALPLSSNGKVDRRRLPAPIFETQETAEDAPLQTEIEAKLAEIWKQVLGLKVVGIHDNFFELGGDSILSIQIIARARQAGIQLTPRQLFENPTIAGQAQVASFGQAIEAEQGIVTGEAPLTPIQRWFFEQDLPELWHWNQTALLEVSGGMKRELLEATVAKLLEQHDALRMCYRQRDGGWVQTNAGEEAIATKAVCRWFDMAGMSRDWQAAALTREATALQASLYLEEGPILRVAYFNLGSGLPGRLLVVIHHLVVDGISWRVLMEDLQSIYLQLLLGQSVKLPPKTTSFREWAQRLARYAESDEAHRELPYWQKATEGRIVRLPVDFPSGANTEVAAESVVVGLDEAETAALLQDVPAAYGTEINDALLAALARALHDWTRGAALVNLEGHGREDILADVDISRTVGWFTTEFPVRLEWKAGESPGEALMRIKEQLRRIPNRGIGYGILKYLSGRRDACAQLAAGPQAEVSFNYMGQFDQTLPSDGLFSLAKEPVGPSRSLQGNCSYLLEINGGITGGRLQLEWNYSAQLYRRETIERVAHAFVAAMRELIAFCQSPEAGGYTPSDFPDVDLSEEQLKELIQGIG
jgi:amino acid adenylation domain-containing protein/non-ribosomal peptide synthase protein (TIGR01720 family)